MPINAIVFETPGLLDVRAFTTFGLHAKPNSTNPIGRFGSGLKNAIAVLVREGLRVQVFIGLTEYEFYVSDTKFRGLDFQQVRMKKRQGFLAKWRYEELPFMTTHARHWELWQAFRELHSNTLDEGGKTLPAALDSEGGAEDLTRIYVHGEAFVNTWRDRDKIFLPKALTQREGDDEVQIFNEPSKHLYWRGMRVFDLEQPSIYTYNILKDLTLTEDRTLKHLWDAQAAIAGYVARSEDHKLINEVVSANPEKFFEGRLDFDYTYRSPSEAFKEVVAKKKHRGSYVGPRALSYYDRYAPPPVRTARTIQDEIEEWAYNDEVPTELQALLKRLLRCEIKEPSTVDDGGIPF